MMEADPKGVSALSLLSSPKTKSHRDGGKDEVKARPYQLELLEAALNENTIVNLGTGAGKTFIAVMLIREYSHQILDPFEEEGSKRTVFLVNTVPLVKQQADYIKAHTLLEVGQYTGDMNVDSWTKQKWNQELDKHHILVMTRQIFLDMLHRGYIHLRDVNLLIFDECHHAVKNDAYVQIMKVFDSCTEDECPRVLGLSASLLPSKCKPGDLETKVKALEATLRCRAETARDLKEVAKYATNPDEELLYYRSSTSDPNIAELRRILEGPVDFLDSFTKDQKTEVYDIVKLYLDDCLHILENLGIWCAHDFASKGLCELEEDMNEIRKLPAAGDKKIEWEKSLVYLAVTHLKIFVQRSKEKLDADRTGQVPLTPKVEELLYQITKYRVASGEAKTKNGSSRGETSAGRKPAPKLLGIIFVERRTTAALLTKLLRHKSQEQPNLKHIRCDYIVGHNVGKGGTHLRREAHMSVKKQEQVLEKFRKENINLLVATSVVEEGVDVPKCNLVVRFDFPQNFRSFIQSKGRARAKPSTYLVLVETENRREIASQLKNYQILEEELQTLCRGRHVPGEEDILEQMEERVPPYIPFGKEAGIRATLSTSLPLIHKYCQKLPSDRYTVLTPIFKTRKRSIVATEEDDPFASYEMDTAESLFHMPGQEYEYCSSMTLPISCPVKDEIEGLWMPTSRIAEKSAALEGVKRLHEAGELNDHLLPVLKEELDSDEEDEIKIVARGAGNAGTEKRSQDYPNETAPTLTDCFPVVGPGNYLYAFVIREAGSGKIYQSLIEDGPHTSFGVLTRKPLPHLKIPEFSLYDGDKELYVTVQRLSSIVTELTRDELSILKQCHKTIFSDVLGVNPTWLEPEFEKSTKSYLVVPVALLPEFEPMEMFLDMDLARQVVEMGNNPQQCQEPIEWPCPLDRFINALVTGIHWPPDNRKLHEVRSIDPTTTPLSPFPDPKRATTFVEYFKSKYNYELSDLSQPALECKAVSTGAARLKLLTSRFKSVHGEDQEKSARRDADILPKLFPQCCSLYPLPANFWKLTRCIPSVLWRTECILLVDLLRARIARETQIGVSPQGFELTTLTNLQGYEDYGFGNLKTQSFSTSGIGEEEVSPIPNPDLSKPPLRGPDNALFLQALTPKRASDSINLERLETLGDSFLKLATSVYLFCDRENAHEGKLTAARARRVGNLNLYHLAQERDIPGKIFSRSFEPRESWIPPCFSFNRSDPHLPRASSSAGEGAMSDPLPDPQMSEVQRHYLTHRVTDKGVADCVESLIGTYLVSGGIEAALKFMKWMEIKINRKVESDQSSQAHCAEITSDKEGAYHSSTDSSVSTPPVAKRPKQASASRAPLFFSDSSTIFTRHFGTPPPALLDTSKEWDVQRLLMKSRNSLEPHQIQQEISWDFGDPSLLLQALTHASYTRNRVTNCYQRLEFLGDAVLDYLVTCHIYSTFSKYGPGEISAMRSALVNNVTFAEFSVKLNLHKALLHNSPALFKQIPQFVEALGSVFGGEEEEESIATVSESSGILQDHGEVSSAALPTAEDEYASDDEEVEELDPPKVLGDVFESLAGAIFLDSGMSLEAVWRVFKHLFELKIDKFEGKIPVSPVQELFGLEPNTKAKSTRSKKGRVRCTITLPERGIEVTAKANSHKTAKQAAAKEALRRLKAITKNSQ